ncbi:glycosyltransferase family 25 protein [Pedobacter sp.]|uniref:glycosyltransferase family 25 protein n=1 Tax=Pedobacter sp. TaxID=1411316 RepID=UPI003BA9F2D5
MKTMNFFSQIYLINLERRSDRLARWKELNSQFVPSEKLFIFQAIEPKADKLGTWKYGVGALGCLESHLEVIKHAQNSGYENILILEDDSVLNQTFDLDLKQCLEELPIDWDMLYLFSQHHQQASTFSTHLNKCNSTLSTVAYALNFRMYNTAIHLLGKKNKQVDVVFAHLHFLNNSFAAKTDLCSHADLFDSDITTRVPYIKKNILSRIIEKIIGNS